MKVAIMAGSLSCGGTERVIVNLADYLIECGHEVTVVTLRKAQIEYPLNPCAERILWDLTADETKSGAVGRISNFLARFHKLEAVWTEMKPDVILSFIGKNNFMALLTSRKYSIPVAVAVRGEPNMEYYAGWMKLMSKTLFKRASKVVLQTKGQLEYFPKSIQSKAIILKNPINSAFFAEPVPFAQRQPLIVCVGRIDENKNHKMLIDAFNAIRDDFPEYKLIIYGEGELRKELLSYVKELGASEQIDLPGNISNVAEKIRIARVFVLPSNTEGSPNTLIEAMCLGLVCISCDSVGGGPRELIEHEKNGLLIPVGDTAILQDTLHNLLNDLQKMNEFSSKSLCTRAIYSREIILDEWKTMLESLANKGKGKEKQS